MKFVLSTLIALLFYQCIKAQNESNNWYFGNQAGINFSQGNPKALTNGSLNMQEGCSAISDSDGNLLFYTDGMHVWNKNHIQMSNGFDLGGAPSSTSVAIIPKPGDSNIYYVISVDENVGNKGLSYSIVDMTLNSGLGDIAEGNKNISLFSPASEKIAVTRHQNGTDYWLVVHKWNSDEFVSYLVNESGIQTGSPVISPRGTFYEGHVSNSRGYLKFSPKGNKLVAAIEGMNILEIFDFDNSTGFISNHIQFPGVYKSAYGVEFSIDGKILYCSERWGNKIYQFNLDAGNWDAIFASETVIGYNGIGMQLGLDGRIYLATKGRSLSVINNPSEEGAGSDYKSYDLSLTKQSYEGLPSFISSEFSGLKFTYKKGCPGEPVLFKILNPEGIQSVEWYFNYPSEDPSEKSSSMMPEYTYEPGVYKIRLVGNYGDRTVSVEQTIEIESLPELNLPASAEICEGDFISVNEFSYYEWSNGNRTNKMYPKTSGTYWVIAKDKNGCTLEEPKSYIDITVNPSPEISYTKNNVTTNGGNDGSIDLTVTGGTEPYNYQWYQGETTEDLNNLSAGNYIVNVSDDKQCQSRESIIIEGTSNCEATSYSCSQLIYSYPGSDRGYNMMAKPDKEGNFYMNCVVDRSFYLAGNYYKFDKSQYFFAKLTKDGEPIWTKMLVKRDGFHIAKMELDKNNNIFISGFFYKPVEIDGNIYTPLENSDAFVAKLSSDGNLLWFKSLQGTLDVKAEKMKLDEFGNVYVGGWFKSNLMVGDTTIINKGGEDFFIAKYSAEGDLEWVSSTGSNDQDYLSSFTINKNNEIFAVGGTRAFHAMINDTISTETRNFIINYSSDGEVIKVMNNPYSYVQNIEASEDNFIVTGQLVGQQTFGNYTVGHPDYGVGIYMLKLDNNLDVLWAKGFSSSKDDYGSRIYVDNKENICIIGSFSDNIDIDGQIIEFKVHPDAYSGRINSYFAMFNSEGNLLFADKVDITKSASTNCEESEIFTDLEQNIYLAGAMYASPTFGEIAVPNYHYGFFIAKYANNRLQANIPETNLACDIQSSQLIPEVSGGTEPYSYLWSTGATDQSITVSEVGSYGVTVIDANSCVASDSVIVSVSSDISLKANVKNATSGRKKDGEINLIVIGGEAPFSYNWSTGSTSEDIYNLAPGEYSVDVTDKNGCTASLKVLVAKSDNPIKLDLVGTYDCSGSNNGSIDLTIEGGEGEFSIEWSNGATTEDISGLSAGWYYVTVSDETFIANDSILLNAENTIQTKLKIKNNCENASNGKIDLDVWGGSSPYSYLWSNGEITEDIKDLEAGTYDVIITDNNGCMAYDTAEVLIDYLPSQANSIQGLEAVCLDDNVRNTLKTEIIEKASYYDWEILPAEAGKITGDGTTSELIWNQPATDEIAITVSGRNNCGNGQKSAPVDFQILNPTIIINSEETIPIGDSIQMNFELTGTPPWDFTYTDGTSSYTVETSISPYQKWISEPGTYKVESLSDAGCKGFKLGEAVEIKSATTSLDALSLNNLVKVYPNPAKNIAIIDVNNNANSPLKIEIINMNGVKVYSKEFKSLQIKEEINLEQFARGTYTIKVQINNEIKTSLLVLK